MKYIDPENSRMGLLGDILNKKKPYPYEYQFSAEKGHFSENISYATYFAGLELQLNSELIKWLKTELEGRYKLIEESGQLWGVSFQKRRDALHFKMRWL